MKNFMKKLALLMLAVSMTVPAASALNMPQASIAEAASTEKLTLYVGEQFDVISAKSIKSNKKSVVKTGKTTEGGYVKYYMIAKKPGTATVTVKSKYGGSTKYKVTVKKNQCKATMKVGGYKYGEVIISLKNNSAQTFDNVTVKYTLKKTDGSLYEEKETTISYVIAKKTAYRKLSLKSKADVDLTQSSIKVTGVTHNPNRTYKDITSKVKVTETSKTEAEKEIEININAKNTTKQSASGCVYYLIKNSNDELIGVESNSLYLSKKSTESASKSIYKDMYEGYDHYEMVSAFYCSKY